MSSDSNEIEVDGVFVSSTTFTSMMEEVAQAGHSMWDMIQKRMLTVMQRPYQMIQIKDQKQEDEALSMELEEIKLKYHRLLLQTDLEIRHRELMECKNKKMVTEKSQQEEAKPMVLLTDKEKDLDSVIDALRSVVNKGSVSQEDEGQKEEWAFLCSMVQKYQPVQKIDVMLTGKEYIILDDNKDGIEGDIVMDVNASHQKKDVLVPEEAVPGATEVQIVFD